MQHSIKYKAPKRSLSHIKNIFEGYDNLLVMSMVDAKNGIFTLAFSDTASNEAFRVVEGVKKELGFVEV